MHLDPKHNGQRDLASSCSVQVVYWKPNMEIWQVDYALGVVESSNVDAQDYVRDYLRQKHAQEAAAIRTIQPPLDDRQLPPFLQRYPWLSMSKGLRPQDMQHLVALPDSKDPLVTLKPHVYQYFQGIWPLIKQDSVDKLLMRMVNSPKPK